MDVHCTTCNEPWDTYHLSQDAIFDTGLSEEEISTWKELPTKDRLKDPYRSVFREAGWEFGKSVINVVRCPACPKDAKADPERLATKQALEELLGSDTDGLAATFEDYRL